MKRVIWFVVGFFAAFPLIASAAIGVGVGTGKIQLDQALKPGGIYTLPPVVVLNTGDEPADYAMSMEFLETQPELWPDRSWFEFTPAQFRLEPEKSASVSTILHLPLKTKPGKYFAFIEAHPNQKSVAGLTTIGVAAAAKLYFTVEPANVFQGMYYRASSFITRSSPWSYIIFGVIGLIIFVGILRRFVSLNISIGKPKE